MTTNSVSAAEFDYSKVSQPTLDTDPTSANYGSLVATVDVSSRRVNVFYVMAENEYGYQQLSSQIQVHVVTNCAYDSI